MMRKMTNQHIDVVSMRIIPALLVFALLLGCTGIGLTKIKDIQDDPESYLGEKVKISGTVYDTLKIGKLSGFRLVDGNDSITVSSGSLPKEGSEVVVEGTVMKEAFIGYYILAKEIG